ncbi:MAG: ABC transporter ATP-binding protein [Acetobacteraceae bacterium]|nr:ABC transporter ATP-binding protein [Acetobacteraceae bacterium]
MSEPALPGECIRAEKAWKIYDTAKGPVEAVAGVSFSVRRGEFVAILGPSGCGKSTLLMMCGGLEAITAGRISVDGAPIACPRTSIGVMFQESTLLPWKSVLDNVMFPIELLHRPRREHMARARELLSLVGLSGFESHKPHQLSGGMRQRAAICRALVYDPDILLMDEPFSALDAITRDEMNDALLDIWTRYTKTALFVTHSIREAVYLADRVLVMNRRPATIVADIAIPIPRPRDPSVGETKLFNELCSTLRGMIEHSHRAARDVTPYA